MRVKNQEIPVFVWEWWGFVPRPLVEHLFNLMGISYYISWSGILNEAWNQKLDHKIWKKRFFQTNMPFEWQNFYSNTVLLCMLNLHLVLVLRFLHCRWTNIDKIFSTKTTKNLFHLHVHPNWLYMCSLILTRTSMCGRSVSL